MVPSLRVVGKDLSLKLNHRQSKKARGRKLKGDKEQRLLTLWEFDRECDDSLFSQRIVDCEGGETNLQSVLMKEFFSEVSTADIQREKNRARELRRSEWWKRKRASGICHYCRCRVPPADLTMDHLIPLVRGGKSTKGNLVPACKDCNTKKKYDLPWEWES